MTTSREPPNDTALAGLKRAHVTLGVCRDEHEASRGERVARKTRLVDPKLESPRRVHPLESSRLTSPRVQASRTRLRRGELALELASLEPTRRLISPTVCYVKIAFWWHAESFAT